MWRNFLGKSRHVSILGSFSIPGIIFPPLSGKKTGSDPPPPAPLQMAWQKGRQFIVFLRNFYFHEVWLRDEDFSSCLHLYSLVTADKATRYMCVRLHCLNSHGAQSFTSTHSKNGEEAKAGSNLSVYALLVCMLMKSMMSKATLIKKTKFYSYIRKFRWDV
jgi:hypothetical protein